ncbi:MAG: acyltransferase family protein [Bacteroidales bacterium]
MVRIRELDALRGIAALAVVIYHYTTRFELKFGYDYTTKYGEFPYGHFGVTLFFMISGFVIFMTLKKINSPIDFAVRRFIRLYPIFWICMILTFSVIYLLDIDSLKVSMPDFVANFTMIPNFLGFHFVDGAYWTLQVELLFYVFIFILLLTKSTNKIIFWGALYLLFIFGLTYFYRYSSFFFYGTLFLAGVNFYLIWTNNKDNYKNHILIFFCGIYPILIGDIATIISTILFYGLFYLFIYGKLRFLDTPILIFLGNISYVLYLTHQNIGHSIQLKMIEYGYTNYFLIIFIPLVVTISISALLVYKIDTPIRSKLLNKWKQRCITSLN